MKFKTTDGYEYEIDHHGVIHQLNPEPIKYDEDYISTYDKPEYKEASAALMGIRLGLIEGICNPNSLVDVGYGKGEFLKLAAKTSIICSGYDVTGIELPEGCFEYRKEGIYDVTCYWDVFEHIEDIYSEVNSWESKYIAISLPDVWRKDFDTWKHRKPNEHLHHFTKRSLVKFVESNVYYKYIYSGHPEDAIRKGEPNNILTVIFERED